MSSTKAMFCDICIIMVLGLAVVIAEETVNSTVPVKDGPTGNCTCGGFPSESIEADAQPLLAQSPGLVVSCDSDGENTCKTLCIALGTAAKAKGPEVLCSRLVNADELKLSAFSKICDKQWTYADMTAEKPLCCSNSQVKPCASAGDNSTETIDAKSAL